MTSGERPQRERVVLAHRRGARMVRTRVEVQEQSLVRAQLGLALRLAAVVVCTVGAILVLNRVFPELAAVTVLGMKLNWLVLAVLGYPFLYGVGRLYVRLAEQAERDFVGVVESEP